MGLYPTPLAENNSPSVPYNGPNVSQYGWTEQETGYYVQLLEYVEKCADILDECEEIRDNLGSQGDLIEDMYQEILLIKQEMDEMMEGFEEDLADFELKYNDFLAKYAQIVNVYNEIVRLHQETLDAAAQAAASASTAIDAATEAEGYAQTALGYAQAADFDAAFASDEADRAQGYAEILEHPYEDMGTHTIMQGYPSTPAFSSMWYITDGGIDPNDPNVLWAAGDMLLYSKRENLWSRLSGQALGGGGQVPIEILGDLIMQQGTKIRFRIDEFNDTTGMSLDSDGDLVLGEIPTGTNQSAPAEKIGLAARELYNIYGTDTDGNLITYRLYDQNFKPTPTEIGAVRRNGDVMTGTLTAPKVKVAASPTATEDLANKGYVDSVAGSSTMFGETPPVGADIGTMWYCTGNGLTYLLYDDGNSTQWIEANPNYPSAIGDHEHDQYMKKTGDTMTGDLKISTGAPTLTLEDLSDTSYGKIFFAHGPNAGSTASQSVEIQHSVSDSYRPGYGLIVRGEASASSKEAWFEVTGEMYAKSNKKVYHQGFKPTASEVGAVAKTGDTMTGGLNIANKLQVGTGADGSFGGSANDLLGRIEVVAPADTNHLQKTGITFHHKSSSTGKISYNQVDAGTSYLEFTSDDPTFDVRVKSNKIYHQGFKPTASDVGAVNKAGDTMTGALNAPSINAGGLTYFSELVQVGFVMSANELGYAELVRRDAAEHEWTTGLRAYGDLDWRIGSSRIYHEGFKPTAAEVGAVSHEEFDAGLLTKVGVDRVNSLEVSLLDKIALLEARIAQLEGGA